MTSIAQKQFSFGTVISESISVFIANLASFVVVSLLLLLPLLLYNLLAVGAPTAGFSAGSLLAPRRRLADAQASGARSAELALWCKADRNAANDRAPRTLAETARNSSELRPPAAGVAGGRRKAAKELSATAGSQGPRQQAPWAFRDFV